MPWMIICDLFSIDSFPVWILIPSFIASIYKESLKKKNTFVDGIDVNYGEKVHIVFPSIDAKEKYYIKLTKGDTGTYAKGTIFLS